MTEAVKEKLAAYGQLHILEGYENLTPQQQDALCRQVMELDFEVLKTAANSENNRRGTFAPPTAMPISEISARAEVLEKIGLDALRKGEVGAVLLAGGEGTRLGYDGPKGAMNIGETRELSLYELHFSNLTQYWKQSGTPIPLFIMTSASTDSKTKAFLEEKNFFGYPRESVFFFKQDMAVCSDFSDKLFFDAPAHIAEAPNGNGGWFSSMIGAGLLEKIEQLGVRWLDVFAVDNALQKIADPCFVGAVIESGCEAGAKVVEKQRAEEKVGVLCLEDGKPSIVEYFEMDKAMSELRNADGSLTYRYGVILNYLFSMERLKRIGQANLPIHKAKKKIPFLGADGTTQKPDEPNGYKYETLVLDMVRLQESCLAYEVDRAAEFAPIKNRYGVDSLDTARELLKGAGYIL